jgi:maltose O-acetyltransferase
MKSKLLSHFVKSFFRKKNIVKYKILSDLKFIGKPIMIQGTLLSGAGKVIVGSSVRFGYSSGANFYSGYSYLNPRTKNSLIVFGNNIWINNCFTAISEKPGIYIGDNTLIGSNVTMIDSDFHSTDPMSRMSGKIQMGEIRIKNNVWIGNDVKILKNVTIGENSIIAAGSIVVSNIPANCIAGGIPCRKIKDLNGQN